MEVNVAGVVTRYAYDALGRRISKTSESGNTHFYWNGDVLLGEVSEDANNTKPSRTYLFEPFSFKPLALVQNNEVFHYYTDHIGTPREITNAGAQVVWSASFKTYGALALAHVNEVDNPLRFQGQYFDSETGLHYNRHRYYDPECGQFTTQDPIGLLGGMNAYQYAPNPMTWVDPWGLSCKDQVVQNEQAKKLERLPDDLAGTFEGGRYSSRVLDEDLVLYRAGTSDRPLGQFFSKDAPVSEIQTRIDKAVLPEWPGGAKSPIDTGFKIKIPKGTTVHTGRVASQGGHYVGGTQQIVVQKPWLLEGVEVLESWPLK